MAPRTLQTPREVAKALEKEGVEVVYKPRRSPGKNPGINRDLTRRGR